MSCAIIDAKLGIERAFGSADIWRRAITELIVELPGLLADIENAFTEKRFEDLRLHVHKLHGESIYCGTSMLQSRAKALELACLNTPNKIRARLKELKLAVATFAAFVDANGIPEI